MRPYLVTLKIQTNTYNFCVEGAMITLLEETRS